MGNNLMVKVNVIKSELPRQKRVRHMQKNPERAREGKKHVLKYKQTENNVPSRPVNAKGKEFDLRRWVKFPK